MKTRRLLSGLLSLAIALTAAVIPIGETIGTEFKTTDIAANAADGITDVAIIAPYRQSEARTMTDMINAFRTGSEAWAWNQDDTEKVYYSGLGELTFDYELEKIAMQRAAELVASYAHTRPDGSSCFAAYTDTYTNTYRGENIAIGTNDLTAEEVFIQWREDEKDYSGQGHRRNMLNSNFTSVGIAHVYYNGCHYWVQEFSSKVGSSVYTEPVDSEQSVNISIADSLITSDTINTEYSNDKMSVGETKSLPAVYRSIRTQGTWSYAPDLNSEVTALWSISSGEDVISLDSEGNVTALSKGSAVLAAEYEGNILNVNIDVVQTKMSGTIYYQLKQSGSAVRFIAEVNIDDVLISDTAKITVNIDGYQYLCQPTRAYRSLIANGNTIQAGEGKCFIISPAIAIVGDGADAFTVEFELDACSGSINRDITI